jgi:transcriptional regulator
MKPPRIPREASHTVRQEIIKLLKISGSVTIRQISQSVHISEKEALGHLEHIRKTYKDEFVMLPSECTKCGFVFEDRDRLKKPGKCPKCRGERIDEPAYTLRGGP